RKVAQSQSQSQCRERTHTHPKNQTGCQRKQLQTGMKIMCTPCWLYVSASFSRFFSWLRLWSTSNCGNLKLDALTSLCGANDANRKPG
ncbi:hypothetical protein M5D96_003929, partial [Drosophila gunungcola]